MINCHFIPQLVLRHFGEDEKIQYFDVKKQKIEGRTTRTVFSEKGYYPEQLEKALSYKTEVQFANILNKKILCEKYSISLTAEEILILKKFLIISMLRVRDNKMRHNAWYQILKRDGIISEDNLLIDFFSGDFFENINKVLECNNLDSLLELVFKGGNMNLFNFVRDVVYSYNVFVKTNNCKKDFIIPDRGWLVIEAL